MFAYDDVKDVCREAFYLLRQDGDALSAESWTSGVPVEVDKCRLALGTAVGEIVDEFRWSCAATEDNVAQWPRYLRNALVYCLARELAIPIAGRAEDHKTLDALYRDKLAQAKARDFEAGLMAVDDPDIREVFALIAPTPEHGDGQVPMSVPDIVDRICSIKASARREVLLAHDWNFAKRIDEYCDGMAQTCPCLVDGRFLYTVPYPPMALRLVSVLTYGGRRAEWKVEDGCIRSADPVRSVRYIVDVEDTADWGAVARGAYVRRLAADVARTVMRNPQDAAIQEQAYRDAVETAKLRDTRESATPTDAWGENYYAMAMGVGRRPAPWER